MVIKNRPQIPFAEYKWRWATATPTEGLNDPAVFLGVLRALCRHEGKSPGNDALLADLEIVHKETGSKVNLGRTSKRNLLRNSGQYWKALGLLKDTDPAILLTEFGREVCAGDITTSEFAAITIATLEIPNPLIQDDWKKWRAAGVRFHPLALLLEILGELAKTAGQGFLTKRELIRVVIPLSAVNTNPRDHADTILAVRKKGLSVSDWPNCIPADNDHRWAHEFLYFLRHYGYVSVQKDPDAEHAWDRDRYVIEDVTADEVRSLEKAIRYAPDLKGVIEGVRESKVAESTERRRILREVLSRPQQAKFRKEVLHAAGQRCLLTSTCLGHVLEAAHIIPVEHNGADVPGNGFCLRSDIHTLFDSGHLRIAPTGEVVLTPVASAEAVYDQLPGKVRVPNYVDLEAVVWRWKYR